MYESAGNNKTGKVIRIISSGLLSSHHPTGSLRSVDSLMRPKATDAVSQTAATCTFVLAAVWRATAHCSATSRVANDHAHSQAIVRTLLQGA